jgi:tRNA threonylcarbamoyl adenosine modification protein (Sua5/YciO/YrdC/YwlC family)
VVLSNGSPSSAELASYAKVENTVYRFLKNKTPGAWTFILKATHQVPRLVMHPKRRTIGIRVPNSVIAQALLAELGEPLLSTTLILPGDDYPLIDPYEIRQILEHQVDLVIDGGLAPGVLFFRKR